MQLIQIGKGIDQSSPQTKSLGTCLTVFYLSDKDTSVGKLSPSCQDREERVPMWSFQSKIQPNSKSLSSFLPPDSLSKKKESSKSCPKRKSSCVILSQVNQGWPEKALVKEQCLALAWFIHSFNSMNHYGGLSEVQQKKSNSISAFTEPPRSLGEPGEKANAVKSNMCCSRSPCQLEHKRGEGL